MKRINAQFLFYFIHSQNCRNRLEYNDCCYSAYIFKNTDGSYPK